MAAHVGAILLGWLVLDLLLIPVWALLLRSRSIAEANLARPAAAPDVLRSAPAYSGTSHATP